MILSFDIDGVLARQNNASYMRACNQILKLGFSEEVLLKIHYREFLACPEVSKIAPKALAWMYYHPLALSQARVIKGALQGIEALRFATGGRIYYCTARYSEQTWWNQSMQNTTKNWLKSNGFPESEQVIFCENYEEKALKLQRLSETEIVIHIDDNWQQLLAHLTATSMLRLIAFGTSTERMDHTDCVVALPNWQAIDSIVGRIGDDLLQKRR